MSQGIKITRMGGLAPRFATELIPDGYAQEALNAKLTSGDLVPYREPELVLAASVASPLTVYPVEISDDLYWMMWATDVDVVRAPNTTLTTQRFYYTGDGVPKVTDVNRATFYVTSEKTADYTQVAGDNETTVKFTAAPFTFNLLAAATATNQFVTLVWNAAASGDITVDASGAETIDGAATITVAPGVKKLIRCDGAGWVSTTVTKYPYDSFDLGLPEPTVAPTIAYDTLAKGGAYTVVAGDSGKTIDCSATPWTLSLTAAATLGNVHIFVVRNLGTGDLTIDPSGSELINGVASIVVKSGEVGVVSCNGTAFSASIIEGSFKGYVYTWVSNWGEESKPSDSSNLLLHTSGQNIVVSALPTTPPAGDYNIRSINIYRTNTGDTGTSYQFVATQVLGSATYTDSTVDAALGDSLESTFYEPPPTDLIGIVNMANGMTAAFHGNEVCFSEPYKPHAWPAAYRYSVDFPIVAIGAIGNSLLITTEGRPYTASGNHPASVSVYPIDLPYPCLSKRALVNMGTGIMYPSYEGLVFVSGATPQLASAQVLTRDEWASYYPTTMFARYYDGKYFGNYTTPSGETKSFIFQNSADRIALLVSTNIWASAGYSELQTGNYYFVQNDALYLWDSPNSQNALMDWKSKDFVVDKPVNMGVAKIYANFSDVPDYTADNAAIAAANAALADDMGYMGGDEVADETEVAGDAFESMRSASVDAQVLFQLWTDKELRWQRYVSSGRPFRLPTGYKTDTLAVRVSARFRVHGILIAETPAALESLDVA